MLIFVQEICSSFMSPDNRSRFDVGRRGVTEE